MLQLEQYEVQSLIYDGRSRVYRGLRKEDQRPVIIKVHRDEYPSERELARFELAYNIGRKLRSPRVIEHLALERMPSNLAVVTEDYGAVSLARRLAENADRMPLEVVLAVACSIVEALGDVHEHNVVHKDINPANVVMNPRTGEVKLIDFGISSQLSRENPTATSPGRLEGTLPYISPEQTGRMNRSLDYRTDFYSFGVLLYQLSTGQLPFRTRDPMELIHSHLARVPAPPREVNPEVPEALSRIIMRLLAKSAEDRYQSASGLLADLQRCRANLGKNNEPFPLGTADLSRRFQIPQKLYGRQTEFGQLLSALDGVVAGGRAMLMVIGQPGIGKTALINELHCPITAKHGRFCAGKFDQFRRDLPYLALTEALRNLIRQTLAEDTSYVETLRRDVLEALGGNGRVLCDIIPELVPILGEQPPVPELGPTEAGNRFNRVVQSFVRIFARPQHPLVMFLDDLQWADLPSLKLMEVLITDRECDHFLLIGAYRGSEVDSAHALLETIRRIQEIGQPVTTMNLGSLKLDDLMGMLSDTLLQGREAVRSLAVATQEKTAANPFFVREFLKSMYEEGHIDFAADQGRWRWNLDAILSAGTTDNVVEFMAARLHRLQPKTRELLQLASCIGSQFDLSTLALVQGDSRAEAAKNLAPALTEGLILPTDASYKYMETASGAAGQQDSSYRFVHDRVQQAAQSFIPQEEKESLHLRIGWLLLESTPPEALPEHLIDIVNHLDLGVSRVDDPARRRRLAELNLDAGKRARASMAAEPARHYLRTGIDLLAADAWKNDYELALALHVAVTDAELLCKDFDAMEAAAKIVHDNARDFLDTVLVYDAQLRGRVARNSHEEALGMTLDVLRELGVRLPRKPGQGRVLYYILRTQLVIGRRSPMALAELPEMSDPKRRAAMNILMNAMAAAYYLGSPLFPIMLCTMVEMSVRYGVTAATSQGYSGFAIISCSGLGQVQKGYEFTKAAWAIMERFNTRQQAAKLILVGQGFIQPWRGPIADAVPKLMDGWQAGLEQGDMEYAVYCGLCVYYLSILAGRQLGPLDERYADVLRGMAHSGQTQSISLVNPWRQLSVNLRNPNLTSSRLAGELCDADEEFPKFVAERTYTAVVHGRVAECLLTYLLGDYERTRDNLESIEPYLESALGLFLIPTHHFYQALSACAAARKDGASPKRAHRNLKRFRKWAKDAPENYAHKAELIEAELASIRGDNEGAIKHYRAAIEGAAKYAFLHEQALATELLGMHYLAQGQQDVAEFYVGRARRLYRRWGANAKVAQLDKRFGKTIKEHVTETGLDSMTSSTVDDVDTSLDLESVTKAARALSGEIKLENVVTQLMLLAIENAGAERGALLLERRGSLSIEGVGSIDERGDFHFATPEKGDDVVPMSIVEYTRRTQKNVVLDDARKAELFERDPYVVARQPASVLSAPILNQGRLIGVVYLENHLTPGVFVPARLRVLELLCAQAAISIENSYLFEQERRQREAFARFVPHEFLQGLGRERITDVVLGDAVEKEMSVLFSDVRGFTTLVESMTPQEAIHFINRYLHYMEPMIKQHTGFVDNYIGDAIMALFGEGADSAVAAGVSMLKNLVKYNEERKAEGKAPVATGIGINTGRLTMGTIGGQSQLKCSVIGDAVNLASRIESLTKNYGVPLLISDRTVERLVHPESFSIRKADIVQVVGKSEVVTLYEVYDADPPELFDAKKSVADAYDKALRRYYRRDFTKALELLVECAKALPHDLIVKRYIKRATEYQKTPPKEWTGVEQFTSKS